MRERKNHCEKTNAHGEAAQEAMLRGKSNQRVRPENDDSATIHMDQPLFPEPP